MSTPQAKEMASGSDKGVPAEASKETLPPAAEEAQPPATDFKGSAFKCLSNAPQIDFSQPQRKTSTIDSPKFGEGNPFTAHQFGSSQPFPTSAPQIDFSQPQRKTSTIDPPPGPFGGADLFTTPSFGSSRPIATPRTNTTGPKSVLDNVGAVQDRKNSFQGLFGALSDAKPTPSLFSSQQQTSVFKASPQVPEKKQDVRTSEDQALELGTRFVRVQVSNGQKQRSFTIHKSLIRARTNLQLDGQNELEITLPDDIDPDTFALYQQLLYTQRLPSKILGDNKILDIQKEYIHLAQLYILAHHLSDITAKNAAVSAMLDCWHDSYRGSLPPSEAISIIYAGTEGSSQARKLIVDLYTHTRGAHGDLLKEKDEFPQDFFYELSVCFMDNRTAMAAMGEYAMGERPATYYHEEISRKIERKARAKMALARALAMHNVAKESAAEENAAEENAAEENAAKEDQGKEDVGKQNAAEEDLSKEDVAKEDEAKEDLGKEDHGKEDQGKESVAEENSGKENSGKENSGKKDQIKEGGKPETVADTSDDAAKLDN